MSLKGVTLAEPKVSEADWPTLIDEAAVRLANANAPEKAWFLRGVLDAFEGKIDSIATRSAYAADYTAGFNAASAYLG